MKALIVTGRMVQDEEYCYPFHRLQEAGYAVDVAVRGKQPCTGITGLKVIPNKDVPELDVQDYRVLVIPGGVKAMEHMRLDEELVQFVADFHASGRVVASICSGAQMLISSGLCKGRHISGYPAIKVDIENAGGIFVDMPAVVDDRIVSSPHYRHLGQWMAATLIELAS